MASLKKRGSVYYAQYYVGGNQRVSLQTDSYQVAKEKLRQIEANLARGEESPLPTRTPIAEVLTAYVEHIRARKTPKSAQTDIYYLREAFGASHEPKHKRESTKTPKNNAGRAIPLQSHRGCRLRTDHHGSGWR